MWPFKKKEVDAPKKIRLLVTGICKDSCKQKLLKDVQEEGVRVVVTDAPVLGVFDL